MKEQFETLKLKAIENKYKCWSHYLYKAIPEEFMNGKILEVGCGNGLSQILSKHSNVFYPDNYLGFDCAAFEPNYLNIISGEAVSFDYSSYNYDTLLAVALIEHIDFYKWEELLERWKENLNLGGHIIIITPFREKPEQFYNQYFEKVKEETARHGTYLSHRVFYITEKTFKCFLGKAHYFKRIKQALQFREEGETLLRAILRFVKRVLTRHPFVIDNLLGKKKCMIFVYKKIYRIVKE